MAHKSEFISTANGFSVENAARVRTQVIDQNGSVVSQLVGKKIFVRPSTGVDTSDGLTPSTAVKTLAAAKALATANSHDTVYLIAESNTAASTTDYQSATLDWSKDGVSLIGIASGNTIGSRARIAFISTYVTASNLLTVSANNCFFANLEVFAGVASANPTGCLNVTGSRNLFSNCQISGIGDLLNDISGAYSLNVAGSENQFEDCYIGLDTILRTTNESEVRITSGTRTIFKRCTINSMTANTSYKAITWTAGSYHTATWLIDCVMCAEQNRTGIAVPTGALLFPAAGNVFMMNGGVFGYADVSTLANANILMLSHYGLSTAANFPGIAQAVAPS